MANNLELSIKVNAETGQLELLGSKFDMAGRAADNAKGAFGKLTGEAGQLLKSLIPLATAGGLVAFFAQAVKGAEEENEALRRLKFTVESTKQSWDASKQSVIAWSGAIQESTRFNDGAALQSLDKLTRATGNVKQAQAAATIAMNLAVSTGKDLAETTDLVNGLINKQQRAIMMAHKEYGILAGQANTAQGVLDALARSTADAALNEESLTKSTAQTKNAFQEFGEQIGQTIIPGVEVLTKGFVYLLKAIDTLAQGVATNFAVILHSFEGLGQAMRAVMTGDFSSVGTIVRETLAKISSDVSSSVDQVVETWSKGEQKKLEIIKSGSQEHLDVTRRETEEEVRIRQEQADKLTQIEQELDSKMAAMGEDTFQKKIQMLEMDVAARKKKINSELKDETAKQAALDKLKQYEAASTAELVRMETFHRNQMSFETVGTAIQTLQIINSLGENGSKAERVRAKALLALQQAVTIGWIWVAAAKSAGETGLLASPGLVALASAQTGLAVAQFAQQSEAIDRAGSQSAQGIDAIQVRGGVPGIDINAPSGGGGGGGGGGGSIISSGGGGGGGSSGGAIIINNYNSINIDIDKLGIDNIDNVMREISERVRQGTTEGSQLALSLTIQATKKTNLAS